MEAAAAAVEGVRKAGKVAEGHMAGESVTEPMVEGEELRSTVAAAVESRDVNEAEPLVAVRGVNSRLESTVVVAVVV